MRTAPEAIKMTNADPDNKPGFCQQDTWQMFDAMPAGDRDHDKDADAVDGWLSEPASARHTDRRPKIGAPCAWSGGSRGNGHRAICVGYKNDVPQIRSTDAGGSGKKATKPLPFFEETWGLHWLGSSDTITGLPITGLKPAPGAKTPARKPKTRGTAVDSAIKTLSKAKAKKGSPRDKHLNAARAELHAIPFIK